MQKREWIEYMSQFQGSFDRAKANVSKAEELIEKAWQDLARVQRRLAADGSKKTLNFIEGSNEYIAGALKNLEDADDFLPDDLEELWEEVHGRGSR
jgi:hypothetical protein